MNTPFFTPITPMYSVKNAGLAVDEKERIMEKVYSSDGFKEFIRQWGDAMPQVENNVGQHKK